MKLKTSQHKNILDVIHRKKVKLRNFLSYKKIVSESVIALEEERWHPTIRATKLVRPWAELRYNNKIISFTFHFYIFHVTYGTLIMHSFFFFSSGKVEPDDGQYR